MSTAYIINFYSNGHISTITSTAGRDPKEPNGPSFHPRKEIRHPRKEDTFQFNITNKEEFKLYSVRVFTKAGNHKVDAPGLFNYPNSNPSAYVPFGTVLTVEHNGDPNNNGEEKTFHYEPSRKAPGSPSSTDEDTGPTTDGPPDVGSIKVGG